MRQLYVFLILCGLFGCVDVYNNKKPSGGTSVNDLVIPASFEFATTRHFTLEIATLDNGNKPLTNVVIDYGFKIDTTIVMLGTTVTDQNGFAKINNTLPDYLDSLILRTQYIGLINQVAIKLNEGANQITLGGKSTPGTRMASTAFIAGRTEAGFTYLSTYDSQGVPSNLMPQNDYIPQDLLDMVNNSLPEGQPVPAFHPEYLGDFNNDTRLKDSADVWVTFVHEGAGYRNALGYYTYNLNSPPTSLSQIGTSTIIFPNVSLAGSGGNLHSGNKVHIGTFAPNTGIGWFLVSDGWNGSQVVQKPAIKYSNKNFNTFTTAQYRQQMVLLRDDAREITLLSFEDISRPGGDNDFNDAVFYVSSNPYTAMITQGLAKTEPAGGPDQDGDGVLDKNDKYPTDPLRAFDIFNPAQNTYGTLAFEDMWPSKGDYDMNDLVADYNFQLVANVANDIVDCKISITLRALGANYHSGFGIELPIDPSAIKSVDGLNPQYLSTITQNSNGTEANQARAVIVFFENGHALFNANNMVNTQIGHTYQQPVSLIATIHFAQPVASSDLGYAPFNPFIFINSNRGAEVHLADQSPTSLADKTMLGTYADTSSPSATRYYKSESNMPWAVNLPLLFDYPFETKAITDTHLKFKDWAQGNAASFKDWYLNKSGYRNATDIYVKQ